MPLQKASAAIAAGRYEEALDALLAAWRATRAPPIADLVDRVSSRLEPGRPAPGGRDLAAKQAAWLAMEAGADAADVPVLVRSLTEVRCAEAGERLARLEARPEDPRLAAGLLRHMEDPPYKGAAAIPFWKRVCSLVARSADTRLIPGLKNLHADFRYQGGSTAGRELGRIMSTVIQGIKARQPELARALTSAETAACASLAAALDAAGGGRARAERSREDLVAAILEAPGDDALRLVFADWLQERGDPLGEFIALQVDRARGTTSPEREKRERILLEAHREAWLGPIAQAVFKDGAVFQRGFLTACRMNVSSIPRAEKLVGLSGWAFVEEIDLRGWTIQSNRLAFVRHPVMRSLVRLSGVDSAIFATEAEQRFQSLSLLYVTEHSLRPLFACTSLPHLRRVAFETCALSPQSVSPLWESELGKRLEELEVHSAVVDLPSWLCEISETAPPLSRFTVRPSAGEPGWVLSLVREKGAGALSTLEARHAGSVDFWQGSPLEDLAGILGRLEPGALRRITVHSLDRLLGSDGERQAWRKALERFPHLEIAKQLGSGRR